MFRNELTSVPASRSFKEVNASCPASLLQKVDVISKMIGSSRNKFIMEALNHFIKAVEDTSYKTIPEIVVHARKMRLLRKEEYPLTPQYSYSDAKEEFKLFFSPEILEKTWDIAISMGWGKNALLAVAVAHFLKMIEQERTPLFPESVFVARLIQKEV